MDITLEEKSKQYTQRIWQKQIRSIFKTLTWYAFDSIMFL